MTKLIFIEGVSGVGKSTTSQKLCDRLHEVGLSTTLYLEGDILNPIDFYSTACFVEVEYSRVLLEYIDFAEDITRNTRIADGIRMVRYYDRKTPLFDEPLLNQFRTHDFFWNPASLVPISEYTRIYKLVWEQLALETSSYPDYLIFDGSLLHHPINDMTRNYNATSEQIIRHLNTLITAVSSLNPQIVYLSSDHVAERLKKARISRKENPPTDEQIRFWENRRDVDLAVMKRLSIPYDIYDISHENWDSAIDNMVMNILEKD